jgi:hypothetical protein
MTLLELPRRPRSARRVFVEPAPGLGRRVARALDALGELPDELDLPGREDLAAALIDLADALDGDADLEPEIDDEAEADADEAPLALFAYADGRPNRSQPETNSTLADQARLRR